MSTAFTQLAPDVFTLAAFTAGEAAILTRIADETPGWSPGVVNADGAVDPALRECDVLHANANPRLVGMCHQRLLAVTSERASAMAPESTLREMQFLRYRAGGGYVDHRDTPDLVATTRVLTVLCYLNDGFAGGETVFAELDLRVRPQAGLAVVFSPLLLHRAEPLISGRKYAITAWYHARG